MMHPRWLLLVAVFAVSLATDQATKMIAVRLLSPGHPVPVAGRWFYLTLERNPGGSFGLLPQATVYFIAASAVVAVALLFYARTAVAHSALLTVAVAMLLGGAVGNLIDRVRVGRVTDFIDLRVWPVFNVADIAVTLGVALIVLAMLLPRPQAAHRPREES